LVKFPYFDWKDKENSVMMTEIFGLLMGGDQDAPFSPPASSSAPSSSSSQKAAPMEEEEEEEEDAAADVFRPSVVVNE
jgi:hypothetical protein